MLGVVVLRTCPGDLSPTSLFEGGLWLADAVRRPATHEALSVVTQLVGRHRWPPRWNVHGGRAVRCGLPLVGRSVDGSAEAEALGGRPRRQRGEQVPRHRVPPTDELFVS